MMPCLPSSSNSVAFTAICTSSVHGRSQLAIQADRRLSAKGPLPCNGLKTDDEFVCGHKQDWNRLALGSDYSRAEVAASQSPKEDREEDSGVSK